MYINFYIWNDTYNNWNGCFTYTKVPWVDHSLVRMENRKYLPMSPLKLFYRIAIIIYYTFTLLDIYMLGIDSFLMIRITSTICEMVPSTVFFYPPIVRDNVYVFRLGNIPVNNHNIFCSFSANACIYP